MKKFLGWAALFLHRIVRIQDRLLRSFFFSFLRLMYSTEDKKKFNQKLYDRNPSYAPGGKIFDVALFPWEKTFLSAFDIQEGSRVLVPACGGGRELAALDKEGIHAVGFDVSERLVSQAKGQFASSKHVQVEHLDLNCLTDPSSEIWAHGPFDALFLGWGGLSYFSSKEEIVLSLKTFREKNSSAPVLVSFLSRVQVPPGRIETWAKTFWKFSGDLLKRPKMKDLESFEPELGFHLRLTPDLVREMAEEAGYEVETGDLSPFPHAYLQPSKR